MKNENKTAATKEGNERRMRIALKVNNCLTNDPCAICGGRCDPGGFDFFAEGTGDLVCDSCAKKYAPEMVKIQQAALSYAERDVSLTVEDIRQKIRDVIDEPVEKRIMKVLNEICSNNQGDIPF